VFSSITAFALYVLLWMYTAMLLRQLINCICQTLHISDYVSTNSCNVQNCVSVNDTGLWVMCDV